MIAHALAALVILYNPGGYVEEFARRVEHLRRPVRIEGLCMSACTMFLGARRVCVTPDAAFMFHQAYFGDYGRARPSAAGTRVMESFLPPRVDAFVHGRIPAPPGMLWVLGSDLISLGVRKCGTAA
jgi:hypothetical protein